MIEREAFDRLMDQYRDEVRRDDWLYEAIAQAIAMQEGEAMPPEDLRKPVGVSFLGEIPVVVCDDGSTFKHEGGEWRQGNSIPGTLEAWRRDKDSE